MEFNRFGLYFYLLCYEKRIKLFSSARIYYEPREKYGPVGSNTDIGAKSRVYYCRDTSILYIAFIISNLLLVKISLILNIEKN